MASLPLPVFTVEDYLGWEDGSPERHEFIDGWRQEVIDERDAVLILRSIDIAVPVKEIYRGVDLL